jgi:hypothetical protein
MKKTIACIGFLILAGCASSGTSSLDNTLPQLQGKNIQEAINLLGEPTVTANLGVPTYIWLHSTSQTMQAPVKTMTLGTVGTTSLAFPVPDPAPQTVKLNCEIRMTTHNNIIQTVTHTGANSACMYYSSKLQTIAAK